jgi:hypothetical protein
VRNLLLFAATLGAPVPELSAEAASMRAAMGTRAPEELWVLGSWYVMRGERVAARDVLRALAAHPHVDASAMRPSLGARVALLEGDTMTARRLLAESRPAANIPSVEWLFFHAGTADALLLAQLELDRQPARARRLAARADHPYPLVHVLLLPTSLRVRAEAARRLGDGVGEREAVERAVALGGGALLR